MSASSCCWTGCCCYTSRFCSRSRSNISRCWSTPLWQCSALRWSRSSRGAITKEQATMSISSNGASMSTQLLPTSRTKGRSLGSVTKSWTLLIRNLLSRRLACLWWNWSSIFRMSRPSETTWINPSIQMCRRWCLLSWSSSTPACSPDRC